MGVYAPLTEHGNLFVDDVLVSSYASVEDHRLAHWAFWPVRVLFGFFQTEMEENLQRVGVKNSAMIPNICSTNQTFLTNVMHNISSSTCCKFQDAKVEMENEHSFLPQKEVYWYARLLHTLGRIFLDPRKFYWWSRHRICKHNIKLIFELTKKRKCIRHYNWYNYSPHNIQL